MAYEQAEKTFYVDSEDIERGRFPRISYIRLFSNASYLVMQRHQSEPGEAMTPCIQVVEPKEAYRYKITIRIEREDAIFPE